MLPNSIFHLGIEYDLQHLEQKFLSFQWKCKDSRLLNFDIRVRYSNHCISEKCKPPSIKNSFIFEDGYKKRLFNIDRYKWSLELPGIIKMLFDKPTSTIQMTPDNNGYIFELKMRHPLPNNEKYYCFVRMKRSPIFKVDLYPYKLDLYIESAYSRGLDPIRSNQRIMFGRMAERLIE